jgi:peptide/nickel transport system permease protein
MRRVLFHRLLWSLLLLLGIITITFGLMYMVPGDPLSVYVRPEIKPPVVEQIRRSLGLDLPWHKQYWHWLRAFATGDFGESFSQHRPVLHALREALPATLQLTMAAMIIELLFAYFAGMLMALKRESWIDSTLGGASLLIYSTPEFWLGLVLITVFSLWLGWLPSSHRHAFNHAEMTFYARQLDTLKHLALPAMLMGIGAGAGTARYIRSTTIEILQQDFIRTVRAYGLPLRAILRHHVFPNTLPPIVTLTGLNLPILAGGAVVIENIFAWPGMGRLAFEAILTRDYPVILATTFLSGVMVVLGSLFADVALILIDPRIRKKI